MKNFQVVKLLRYLTAEEYFIMANEFIFIAFILYYIIEEALELKKHGIKYLFSVWNMLDIIVVVVSAFYVVSRAPLALRITILFFTHKFLCAALPTNNIYLLCSI